jgi:hypothetical protein
MKKLPVLALASLISILTLVKPALANETAASSAVLKKEAREDQKIEIQTEKLESFLDYQNSPLADFSRDFVIAADRYGLDWRLLPAITGVESTYGKQIPANSCNAYGWNNGAWQFTSWPESINYVTQALKERYYDRGLNTVAKIAPVYAPPSKTWAGKVISIMEKIDAYSSGSQSDALSLTL